MKTTSMLGAILASAAIASAQVKYEDGKYVCEKANVAYCAGDSLGTDIIIRCNADKVGQPGRCSDNLAGQPPLGVKPALCWQSSPTAGDAACEKNCVVYATDKTFTLPTEVCKPTYTASSTAPSSTSTASLPPTSSSAASSSSGGGAVTQTSAVTVTTAECPPTITSTISASNPTSIATRPPYSYSNSTVTSGTNPSSGVTTRRPETTLSTTLLTNPPVTTKTSGAPGGTKTGTNPPIATGAAGKRDAALGLVVLGVVVGAMF
ncbi:hypothetical protein VTI74DRAFT_3775 [Chaetomium olivicolor]